MVETLTAAEKAFMLKTVELLIREGQITNGRQIIMRYIGNNVFTDEELEALDELTEQILNPEGE